MMDWTEATTYEAAETVILAQHKRGWRLWLSRLLGRAETQKTRWVANEAWKAL